uniref:Uncharacterized protein n=1 Tax=Octopus bimaculoides TaxID=37653 RepID=A0A0L8FK17_OCTBM
MKGKADTKSQQLKKKLVKEIPSHLNEVYSNTVWWNCYQSVNVKNVEVCCPFHNPFFIVHAVLQCTLIHYIIKIHR